ncbi:MAG TPA: single-stranded DNA-binding protein [Bacteroidales bacterium]|nr:single-stranded DNA-binding protein [Bacteroidales bacterium]
MSTINNKVTLIGNLGKDPEVKDLDGGRKVAKFTVATTESYKNETGDKISETSWHNVIAWNGLATIAEKYLKKGREVAVEGRISYRNWEDKEGIKRYFTEIILSQIHLLRNGETNVLTGK